MTAPEVTLAHARIVDGSGINERSLSFSGGRICEPRNDDDAIDLHGHVIFPGLINGHDHLQLNAIPPVEQTGVFSNSYAWIDAIEARRGDADFAAAGAIPKETRRRHGGLKNLLAGATTVAHHDPWHAAFDSADFPVFVIRDLGWCHSLELGASRDGRTPRYGPLARESFAGTPAERPWVIHLAEGTDHVAAGELEALDELGCLASNTIVVHGVGLRRSDVERVIDRGAAVIWCPASNLRMLGATLDPRRLLEAGRLTIGTDSRLTGSRDLLDELRAAAGESRLAPRDILRAVTADAARLFRIPDRGSLDVGSRADCVILRGDGDPYGLLLGTERASIRAVVREGKPAIADPDFADWFTQAGVGTVQLCVDGRPKLIDRRFARPEVIALEPGVDLR